jgi:predicted N-acetyltransferase YhbS
MPEVNIRQERTADYPAVFKLIEIAFQNEPLSDHKEQFLVNRLRKSKAFIPELSLVAENNQQIIGHILLTRITIKNELREVNALALAPVSVIPEYQGRGIGSQLIQEAHLIAKALGHESIVLLGHQDYYPRFGYELTSKYNVRLPFEAPEVNCMILDLQGTGLKNTSGLVVYDPAFFE